jgi:selenocysteine lyase/cysteine desulfurase
VANSSLYLNSAYITPSPLPVVAAGREFAEAKAESPISLGDMLQKTDVVRGQFAKLIGAAPDEVGFLASTSEGENVVAGSLGLANGDNVVIDELHYETEFVLYGHLARTTGVELRVARALGGAVTARELEPLIDRRTKLVSVAWVSHQNGFRHDMRPIADLAHAHGAFFYADGIQAVGMFPLDVKAAGVDAMAAGTYKWLLASYGVAPFYVSREGLPRLRLDRYGALHVKRELGPQEFEIYDTVRKFEYATLAFEPVYQLGAGLAYLERVGVGRIEAHTVGLAHRLHRGLTARGFLVTTPEGNRSSIVAFRVDKALEDITRLLAQSHTQVSVREKGSQIRVSPALFNTESDIDRFLALAEGLR